ncbi:hypothetical protein HZ326_25117 [Fusarium oxysporum f. sp. albedinis]|nr:hypothetical protein HZ326_25117 [Fusarium oxysporum f. sp. albedinis]
MVMCIGRGLERGTSTLSFQHVRQSVGAGIGQILDAGSRPQIDRRTPFLGSPHRQHDLDRMSRSVLAQQPKVREWTSTLAYRRCCEPSDDRRSYVLLHRVNILETATRLKQYQRLRLQGQIYCDNPVPQCFQFVNVATMPKTSSPTDAKTLRGSDYKILVLWEWSYSMMIVYMACVRIFPKALFLSSLMQRRDETQGWTIPPIITQGWTVPPIMRGHGQGIEIGALNKTPDGRVKGREESIVTHQEWVN